MKILMTMFGWNEPGGGTSYPRMIAKSLQKRGHQVKVLQVSTFDGPTTDPYSLSYKEDHGVQLIGIHNRPTVFLDSNRPDREIEHPEIMAILEQQLNEFQPDIVHFHNLLGFSIGLAKVARQKGYPCFFNLYNQWMLCPVLYLLLPDSSACAGVNEDGSNCMACVGENHSQTSFVERRDKLRDYAMQYIDKCLTTGPFTKKMLVSHGYNPQNIDVLYAANLKCETLWNQVGKNRSQDPPEVIQFAFVGTVLPLKGVHILVKAVQQLRGNFEVTICGEGPDSYLRTLKAMDSSGRVFFEDKFSDEAYSSIMQKFTVGIVPALSQEPGSLVAAEFQAAGCPVLCSDIGGVPDYVQPETGATFKPGNSDELAQLMQELIDNPQKIVNWQKNIKPPLLFDEYLDALETYYKRFFLVNQRNYSKNTYYSSDNGWSSQGNHIADITQYPWNEDQMQDAQQVWVPSTKVSSLLKSHDDKTEVIPYYLSSEYLNFKSYPLDFDTLKTYKILSIFDFSKANWKLALQAYLKSYQAEDNITYILVPFGAELQTIKQELVDWLESSGEDLEQTAEMQLHLFPLEELSQQWTELYASTDCYVSIPNSEDLLEQFTIQALATETPVLYFGELPFEEWQTLTVDPHQTLQPLLRNENNIHYLMPPKSFAIEWNDKIRAKVHAISRSFAEE